MKRLLLLCSCVLLSQMCLASAKPIKLVLNALLPYKVSERGGDELYMDCLVYPSKGRPKHFTIPKQPLHWPSFMIKKLHNVVLWKSVLPVDETVTLHAALLEKDAPPWNRDELIGTFILVLSNKAGVVSYALLEDQDDKKVFHPLSQPLPALNLTGNGSHYEMQLKLVDSDVSQKKK